MEATAMNSIEERREAENSNDLHFLTCWITIALVNNTKFWNFPISSFIHRTVIHLN